MVKYFDTEDLLELASVLGVKDVRDIGLLDSAANRPTSVVFGNESYPTMALKGAALIESIIGNHPLIDGNKRLGWAALIGFYVLNGVEIHLDDDVAYDFVINIASGKIRFAEIAEQLEAWTS